MSATLWRAYLLEQGRLIAQAQVMAAVVAPIYGLPASRAGFVGAQPYVQCLEVESDLDDDDDDELLSLED